MVLNRFLMLVLVFAALLAVGCMQSAPSSATATPAGATVLPTVVASPTPDAGASASPTARIPYIASAKPSELPSSTPAPSVAVGIPTLVEFAADFNVVTNDVFNDTREAYESAENVWVIDHSTNEFKYTIFIKPARARSFGAFDTVRTLYGSSGMAKNVSLDEGETGPYYEYSVVMKCYDAHFDVEMTLLDYFRSPDSQLYRRTLGSAVMPALVDACPN